MYQQVRPFNQLKAGKQRHWCLRNVRLGYGIGAKYATAWEAWTKTKQFTTAIPNGVDVPVFFSYTATIGGVRKNYGHVGVRLANGQFWTDGKVYRNLTVYRLTHPTIRYKGWSHSLNDVAVMKFVAPKPTPKPSPKMPKVGSKIKVTIHRTTYKNGTQVKAGTLKAPKQGWIYTVRGYDKKYKGRILINSASAGGNGVALALYYTNGKKIEGWTVTK